MRIAFDVKGTLYGHNQENVRRLFKAFEEAGHTMFVWSNSFGYAVDAVRDLKLNAEPLLKKGTFDYQDKSEYMDLCIEDDHSQIWLGSKLIYFVDQIKSDNIDKLVKVVPDAIKK